MDREEQPQPETLAMELARQVDLLLQDRQDSSTPLDSDLAARLAKVAQLLNGSIARGVAHNIVSAQDLLGSTAQGVDPLQEDGAGAVRDGDLQSTATTTTTTTPTATAAGPALEEEDTYTTELLHKRDQLAELVNEKLAFLHSVSDMASIGLERKLI